MMILFSMVAVIAMVLPALGAESSSPLDYKLKSIDGKPVDLSQYKGKVVLIVNVASQCGNTPQYKGLEELYKKYKDQGLTVLGVPANEFGKQEPGSNAEIKEFCTKKYDVSFPMLEKVVVKGDGITPLYEHLTSPVKDPKFAGDVSWNFEKFLIGRDGQVVNRFKPKVQPTSDEVVNSIETELKKK